MAGNTEKANTHKPKEPERIFTYPGGAAVYAGAAPSSETAGDKPVVVFVPGLGGVAQSFWEGNSMYENAYNSGFRTAFVGFSIPGGKAEDMWSNGKQLARQLADICSYFNVPRVVIVAHSKGGVDSQTAAVYYGAAEYIGSIITLSTPHWGSQLADIAYSTVGWSIAELMKAHSPGCYSMQTGYMREYRRITDNKSQNKTPIKTFAGNAGNNDEFSKTWFGSFLLDRFGENDGVVTVESAQNPKGRHYGTLRLNHAQMAKGDYIWEHLKPLLDGDDAEPAVAASAAPSCDIIRPAHILKGGRLDKGVDEDFYVDSSVESFTVSMTLAGGSQPSRFALTSPDGRKTPLSAKREPDGIIILRADVKNPQVGKWRLTSQPDKGAYCALISLQGKSVFPVCPANPVPGHIKTNLRIIKTYVDGYDVVGEYSFSNDKIPNSVPKLSNGVYTVEMRLLGELDDGSTFERSVVRPFAECDDLKETIRLAEKH